VNTQQLYLGSSRSSNSRTNNNDNKDDDESIDMLPLALKFAVIMGIKTVRDAVTYPTIYASNAVQSTRRLASDTTEGDVNVPVMFLKFVLIMTFKTIHDLFYYPAVYIFGNINHLNSDDGVDRDQSS
jgi:hypothetical protein